MGRSLDDSRTSPGVAADNGFKVVGIPDGLGAFDNGDGAWSLGGRSYNFATTGTTAGGASKLYRLNFDGSGDGFQSGSVEMLLDSKTLTGTDGEIARSLDSLTAAANGKIVIQGDPGGQDYIARTWAFDPKGGKAVQILESDRPRSAPNAAGFLTNDEESSGVIEITDVLGKNTGKRYFMGDLQAHFARTAELVQGKQLFITTVPESESHAMLVGGLGLIGSVARRRQPRR